MSSNAEKRAALIARIELLQRDAERVAAKLEAARAKLAALGE